MMAANGKVVVAGASGLIGQAAIREFGLSPGWEVVGVSRRQPAGIGSATWWSLDLTDAAACEETLSPLHDVTHVIYAALQEAPGLYEGWLDPAMMQRNGDMLKNFFEPISKVATGLRHVSLLHGTKAYGLHHPAVGLEGVHNPLRERDPRREHPNFYWIQEDYLHAKQQGASWGLTVFRPTVVYGGAPGNNMNPILPIAAYAALLRYEGRPLDYPGEEISTVVREAVDADLVARALLWAAESQAASGGTFNLTNGDVFLWSNVWPVIAETMGMRVGEHRPTLLVEELPQRNDQWAELVERYELQAPSNIVDFCGYNSIIYADTQLSGRRRPGPDPGPILNSTIAARQAGFHDCIDTEDMFVKWFRRLQEDRVLPPG
jgi:nucleoside-diphosphate-sugar epimerase